MGGLHRDNTFHQTERRMGLDVTRREKEDLYRFALQLSFNSCHCEGINKIFLAKHKEHKYRKHCDKGCSHHKRDISLLGVVRVHHCYCHLYCLLITAMGEDQGTKIVIPCCHKQKNGICNNRSLHEREINSPINAKVRGSINFCCLK